MKKRTDMAEHDEMPERVCLSASDLKKLEQLFALPYFAHIEKLREKIIGKKVVASSAGRSGYFLMLNDDSWVISFVENAKLDRRTGSGNPGATDLLLMNAPDAGDGRDPLTVNLPYAETECDIEAEIANAHGKPITDIAIGENSFNICFPKGRELDAMIVPDSEGRIALRVFWEQW